MSDNSIIKSLEVVLEPLGEDARNTVLLAVEENWRWPPMTRETVTGEGDDFANFLKRWPSITNQESGILDFDKVDQMMATGQIAYPMMLKKAPIISIVRSASGFTIKSSDEQFSKIALENLKEVLPKKIEEVLTYLEYGAYFGEITYEPVYPQIYGLPKSDIPYWVISDFNGVHPNTITKILRNEDTKVFEGFIQQPAGFHEPVEVGVERALIIPNNGMFGNLNGTSVLEPVYVWWFWYEMVWRAFLRFLQRAGVGVVVVKAPSRGRVEVGGKSVDNMQWALQMASSLHRTNYAVVPSDMDSDSGNPLWVIDYLKMGQNEGAQFAAALELLSTNIKNYLLTGNSGAPTEGAEFEVMLDTERILGHIGMYVSEYILPKMLYWNNSDTNKATLEFQGANSRVLPLLFKLMAVAGNTAGDALQNVDWRLLFNKGGVPVLSEEEVEELKEEKKKEQEEMMQKKQEASEKAKMPPGGEGRWTAKRDQEGQAERLSMVKEALRVPLIALTAGQVAELEYMGLRLPDDKPIAIYDPDRHEETMGEYKLFNPYHDERGRFTDRAGATGTPSFAPGDEKQRRRIISRRGGDGPFQAKGTSIASGFTKVAGLATTASILASQGKHVLDPKYGNLMDSGAYISKLVALGSGAMAAGAWGIIWGRLAINHGKDFATEVRREITYKGKNKKAVFDRISDSFDHARKSLGWGGKSAIGLGGAAAAAGLLYAHLTGKTNQLAWAIEDKTKIFSTISHLVGEGWTTAIYEMIFGGKLKFEDASDIWLTKEMIEVLPEWLLYFADGAENGGAEFFDMSLTEEECEQMVDAIGAFLVGYMSESNVELEYKLFNPYHDEEGRFTSKNRAVGIFREAKVHGADISRNIANEIDKYTYPVAKFLKKHSTAISITETVARFGLSLAALGWVYWKIGAFLNAVDYRRAAQAAQSTGVPLISGGLSGSDFYDLPRDFWNVGPATYLEQIDGIEIDDTFFKSMAILKNLINSDKEFLVLGRYSHGSDLPAPFAVVDGLVVISKEAANKILDRINTAKLEEYTLYNPYHDARGKFTDAAHAVSGFKKAHPVQYGLASVVAKIGGSTALRYKFRKEKERQKKALTYYEAGFIGASIAGTVYAFLKLAKRIGADYKNINSWWANELNQLPKDSWQTIDLDPSQWSFV